MRYIARERLSIRTKTHLDGSNIVGSYDNGGFQYHGFKYDDSSYTALDYPEESRKTFAYGIDGSNIVGYYIDGSGFDHGFQATGVPLPQAAWMALPLLAVIGAIGKMRREVQRQRHSQFHRHHHEER